ncbi:DUF2523 family protein [Marinobacter sp. CA1]|uniref:DUF2523 family protein n=1 Tax=Marinobacter sp. CA1 TaxID=2817656 RepID=UPI001D069E84|nr:DUF2523 family protein [Marinobacter sp. CA1]UDL05739.1 DUF2523 domain-containing protein [Marinobacter sp. CA1]
MPALLRWVWYLIISAVPYIVVYVLRGIGFGLVTFTGMTIIFDQLESIIFSKLDGMQETIYQFVSLLGVPLGIKILFTAAAVAIAIKTAVKPSHPVWRKPGSPWEA